MRRIDPHPEQELERRATELTDRIEHVHAEALPETRLSRRLDRCIARFGRILSWVWLALLSIIVLNVTLRYVFGSGRIEFEEAQWHLYSIGFLGALACCVETDSHIRVDFLSERFSARMRAWIELYGILLLALPFIALVIASSISFFGDSFDSGEISPSPGGLPYRWLIKSAVPLSFGLLAVACVSRVCRVSSLLFGAPRALQAEQDE